MFRNSKYQNRSTQIIVSSFILLASLNGSAAPSAPSTDKGSNLVCRAKAKELAVKTYSDCLGDNQNAQVEKIKADYRAEVQKIKSKYANKLKAVSKNKPAALEEKPEQSVAATMPSTQSADPQQQLNPRTQITSSQLKLPSQEKPIAELNVASQIVANSPAAKPTENTPPTKVEAPTANPSVSKSDAKPEASAIAPHPAPVSISSTTPAVTSAVTSAVISATPQIAQQGPAKTMAEASAAQPGAKSEAPAVTPVLAPAQAPAQTPGHAPEASSVPTQEKQQAADLAQKSPSPTVTTEEGKTKGNSQPTANAAPAVISPKEAAAAESKTVEAKQPEPQTAKHDEKTASNPSPLSAAKPTEASLNAKKPQTELPVASEKMENYRTPSPQVDAKNILEVEAEKAEAEVK